MIKVLSYLRLICLLIIILTSCHKSQPINEISDLQEKRIGLINYLGGDQQANSYFPGANFEAYTNVYEAVNALKKNKISAIIGDILILKKFVSSSHKLQLLDNLLWEEEYVFVMRSHNSDLKNNIDKTIHLLAISGIHNDMIKRWFPDQGQPEKITNLKLSSKNGVLRFGTVFPNEPFSYFNKEEQSIGYDIEIAYFIAQALEMELEVVSLDFYGLIPALLSNRVDFIGGTVTVPEERMKTMLYSEPYYHAKKGILVKK